MCVCLRSICIHVNGEICELYFILLRLLVVCRQFEARIQERSNQKKEHPISLIAVHCEERAKLRASLVEAVEEFSFFINRYFFIYMCSLNRKSILYILCAKLNMCKKCKQIEIALKCNKVCCYCNCCKILCVRRSA